MTQASKNIDYNELLKQAYLSIEGLNRKLESFEKQKNEPIAVIGMGCRYPGGVDNPEAYWRLLQNGQDGITTVPQERWDIDAFYDPDPDAEGKMYSRWGGFIENVTRFEPQFFGITPREAKSMDPQQRLLLEVTWEALEHAGCAPEKLSDSLTGVFVGICSGDYASLMDNRTKVRELYSGTGNSSSIAAGRLSYFLGLHGPCLSIDTACSSSAVSVHLAVQSLRQRECNLALAGGVNLILAPEPTIIFCRGRMLSFDRYCKTFDAAADGYVRGEGCGMILLKRLSDAQADGDRVLALIRGSAVNQDGRSSGLTAPNGVAQEAVLRSALNNAGVKPSQVGYVEAHGTGTALGDPIEMRALNAVIGAGHGRENPLWVGSVKTNFGHLEAAAGIASLMKAILVCQYGQIPSHLHFTNPSPHIPWDTMSIRVPTKSIPWPEGIESPIVGVSSFGFSGTNAHVIVQAAPPVEPRKITIERPLHVLSLSVRKETGIKVLAERFRVHLDSHSDDIGDVCFTAGAGRSHFGQRLAVVADNANLLSEKLESFNRGELDEGVFFGKAPEGGRHPKVAFLFTGQGAQYVGMGRELYQTQPTFRKILDECDELLRSSLGQSLVSVLYPEPGAKAEAEVRLNQTGFTQPALFVLEYALAQLWRSWGVEPSVVMGHSVGEYVAACVADLFSLEDGLKLVAERGRLMQELPSGGRMAAVLADEKTVSQAIEPYRETVAIAALNGPENTVISGVGEHVAAIVENFSAMGIGSVLLRVSHAFHSPLMDPMLDAFERSAARVRFRKPRIRLISTLIGKSCDGSQLSQASWWRRHVREPVRFSAAIKTLFDQGCRLFVEIGPHPTLMNTALRCLPSEGVQWMPSLRRGHDDWQLILKSLGALYVSGVPINWQGFDGDYSRSKVALPTYPFQRERYWIEPNINRIENRVAVRTVQAPAEGEWLYRLQWQSLEDVVLDARNTTLSGRWIVFCQPNGSGCFLPDQLRARGAAVHLVYPGELYSEPSVDQTVVRPSSAEDMRLLFEKLGKDEIQALRGIVYLWSTAVEAPKDDVMSAESDLGWPGILNLVQSLPPAGKHAKLNLNIVTSGGVSIDASSEKINACQAMLWGLGRVVASELPHLQCKMVDIPLEDFDADQQSALCSEITTDDRAENQIALRKSGRLGLRLVHAEHVDKIIVDHERRGGSIRSDAAYVITGGTGGLGLHVSRWLVDQGARHLILLSRKAPRRETLEAIQQLEHLGAKVVVANGDVGEYADLKRVLSSVDRPIKGIIHAAGVIDDATLVNQEKNRFEKVLHAKVHGGWNLHRLTEKMNLDFFVMFSSAASVFGSTGQGNYASANAFMDGLCLYRRYIGLPALSINWGPWSTVGMASGMSENERLRWEQSGLHPIKPDAGLRAFKAAMAFRGDQLAILHVEWQKNILQSQGTRVSPLLSVLVSSSKSMDNKPALSQNDILFQEFVQEGNTEKRQHLVESHLKEQLKTIFGFNSISDIDEEQGFFEMGMDSIMAVELSNRLSQSCGCLIANTIAFDYTNLNALAEYLISEVLTEREDAKKSPQKWDEDREITEL